MRRAREREDAFSFSFSVRHERLRASTRALNRVALAGYFLAGYFFGVILSLTAPTTPPMMELLKSNCNAIAFGVTLYFFTIARNSSVRVASVKSSSAHIASKSRIPLAAPYARGFAYPALKHPSSASSAPLRSSNAHRALAMLYSAACRSPFDSSAGFARSRFVPLPGSVSARSNSLSADATSPAAYSSRPFSMAYDASLSSTQLSPTSFPARARVVRAFARARFPGGTFPLG